ncbi:unnamed protein product [Parascedosporium putredinis]|uniref:Class E vacuolar protein-sorting machinery protein HSE1 n=1 Tax=Parascedosporium putredinis TaxID=1442378 RepID=A0A9P1GVM3_9PEZI|nr:unnamed protein product [Parascedosporium putredinis]CAI7988161.1 unnamed protein product [Parascedosporium putredinis]
MAAWIPLNALILPASDQRWVNDLTDNNIETAGTRDAHRKGVIEDDAYETIMSLLPAERPLHGPSTPAPVKPVLSHARALYRYEGQDARDLSFEKDDRVAIHEYMNADWWMGKNLRTGQEGIFPTNYVALEESEKAGMPGPSAPMNPYNAHVPPMAVADGNHGEHTDPGPSKLEQGGKKFGKKLGNAAIFGAGATIGSNIVNSIF